jgi:hypothetical protein
VTFANVLFNVFDQIIFYWRGSNDSRFGFKQIILVSFQWGFVSASQWLTSNKKVPFLNFELVNQFSNLLIIFILLEFFLYFCFLLIHKGKIILKPLFHCGRVCSVVLWRKQNALILIQKVWCHLLFLEQFPKNVRVRNEKRDACNYDRDDVSDQCKL